MEKKIALISGASRGLGRILAMDLAHLGYTVYAGVRKLEQAPPYSIPILLEMTSDRDRKEAIRLILHKEGKIDLLILNAAEAYWGAVDSLTTSEVSHLFEVNVVAPVALTQLVLPSMRAKRSGRLLFISSIRATESCAYMGLYSGTKAALEAIAFDWACSCERWNITVSVAIPGPLDTQIELKHGTFFETAQENPYLPYGEVALNLQPPEEASQAILSHIQDPHPPFRFPTSLFAAQLLEKHLVDPPGNFWCEEQKKWVKEQLKDPVS